MQWRLVGGWGLLSENEFKTLTYGIGSGIIRTVILTVSVCRAMEVFTVIFALVQCIFMKLSGIQMKITVFAWMSFGTRL